MRNASQGGGVMTPLLPCPRCTALDWNSRDDRNTETIMDRCRDCDGTNQIPAATGKRRDASCDPATVGRDAV